MINNYLVVIGIALNFFFIINNRTEAIFTAVNTKIKKIILTEWKFQIIVETNLLAEKILFCIINAYTVLKEKKTIPIV